MPVPLPSFLTVKSIKLLFFGGKGGVGKTTCAASVALHLASSRPSQKLLLLSTDPAHSINDALAGTAPPTNLEVIELCAETERERLLQRFGQQIKAIAEMGTLLDGTDVERLLGLSVPGIDELIAFLFIADCVDSGSHDCIVVDTAPSGHGLRLLGAGETLRKWVGVLDSLLSKHRTMRLQYARGRALPADPLDTFVNMQQSALARFQSVMHDMRCCRFVPVLSPEMLSLSETGELIEAVDALGISSPDVVFNRVSPPDQVRLATPLRLQTHMPDAIRRRTCWQIPQRAIEPRGVIALLETIHLITPLDRPGLADEFQRVDSPQAPECLGQIELPTNASAPPLLFFVGKGGTGKTSMAIAAALAIATSGKRCLLVSADPGHSLMRIVEGAALSDRLAKFPTLDVMRLEANANALASRYTDDLNEALSGLSGQSPLGVDGLENMMELAPPGIDLCLGLAEVMGIIKPAAASKQIRYEAVVVDTAATGHFLRLLELPGIILDWAGALLSLIEKYEVAMKVPRLEGKLFRLSRSMRQLRALFGSSDQCRMYAVAIPTELCFEETTGLLRAAESKGIRVDSLIVNMMSAAAISSTPVAHADAGRAISERYRNVFPQVTHAQVLRSSVSPALMPLATLGSELFVMARLPRSPKVGG